MKGSVTNFCYNLPQSHSGVTEVLRELATAMSTRCLSSAGLVINAASSPLAKAGTAFHAIVGGRLVSKAINTAMGALSGSVTNARHNVYVFYVDAAGTMTTVMGRESTSLSTVLLPETPDGRAAVGYVYVNPTGTGPFIGGTTPLDDATVVPNAIYVNLTGVFDPSILP